MKMVKSLLLGTAAGLVAMTGAQAADLPVKAKPVQYVKICSLYGAGFYYIPGTDTCLKIGGWVRAEYNVNAGGSFNPHHINNFTRGAADENTIRVRAMITADARSQTEYGTLRAYIASGWNRTNSADALYVPRAFVQLGGFTWGLAQSFFDFYNTPAFSNTTNVWASDTGGNGQTVAAYTAKFGNGLSATISLEDPLTRRTILNNTGYEAGPGIPDVVANLRIDQPWGSAQVMAAIHQIKSQYYGAAPSTGHPGDEFGFAVGAGLTVNLPMIGKGDTISAQVTYAEGALRYVGSGLSNFGISQGSTSGVGYVADAVYGTAAVNPALQLTTGWSVVAGYQHAWNSQWKTSLYGTYGEIDYGNTAEAILGSAAGTSHDWSYWQAGSRTVWTPVQNLDLSLDVMYNQLNSASSNAGTGIALPAGNTLSDQDWWQAIVRVQRNFYP